MKLQRKIPAVLIFKILVSRKQHKVNVQVLMEKSPKISYTISGWLFIQLVNYLLYAIAHETNV